MRLIDADEFKYDFEDVIPNKFYTPRFSAGHKTKKEMYDL